MAGPTLVDFVPFLTLIIAIILLAPLFGNYHVGLQTAAAIGLLSATCSLFFTTYPLIMKWVWRTYPLPAGEERVVVIPAREAKVVHAMVSGILPRTRTIFVTDALLQKLTPEEIRCIVAHELGHLYHRHLVKYFFFSVGSGLLFSLAMYGLSLEIRQSVVSVTLQGILLGTLVAGVFGGISRRFEREANLYALRITRDPEALISALEKLEVVLRRAADPDSPVTRILGTHPSLAERVSYPTESSTGTL